MPTAVGFRPSSGELLWTQPISGDSPELLETSGSGHRSVEMLSGGVFYSSSEHVDNVFTLVARNAETGELLWEVPVTHPVDRGSPSFQSLRIMGNALLLEEFSSLFVFRKKNGDFTGFMGHR
jgi:outer membrane protein assembly factor BamB